MGDDEQAVAIWSDSVMEKQRGHKENNMYLTVGLKSHRRLPKPGDRCWKLVQRE
jgi:hypothetical protein